MIRAFINFIFLAGLVVAGLIVSGAVANDARDGADGAWLRTDFAEARLISTADSWSPHPVDTIWRAALEVQLKAGWKIYWRSPGDAGLPPQIFLDAESKAAGYEHVIRWPVPERFTLFGLETYGYGGRVILPVDITVPAGQPAFVSGVVDMLACSDICVPMQGKIQIGLAEGAGSGFGSASRHAQDIAYARAQVPSAASGPDIDIRQIWVDTATNSLLVSYHTGAQILDDIYVEGAGGGFSFAKPKIEGGKAGTISKTARIQVSGKPAQGLIGRELRLTVLAGEQRAETSLVLSGGDMSPNEGIPSANSRFGSLLAILLVAFLGGVILNVMPCVLPVLSLKIISILSMVDETRYRSRQRFLASASGIMVSFLVLGFGLIIVRAAGVQIGWGIQFQQPIFLAFMLVFLGLFALSLFDKVIIPAPAFLSSLPRPDNSNRGNLRGDFMAGMMATLLATPCSAPFVGTAISFAVTASNTDLLGVMLSMGLGLASPWLLLALRPELVAFLPKPGRWMIWLKRAMGVLLLGTMIWVGWLLVGTAGWRQASSAASSGDHWQVWSPAVMDSHMGEGHIVLVDVTADWCITCKTNKLLVLDSKAGVQLTDSANIVRLQANWTRPSPQIAAFLATHGRYGIPFNMITHKELEQPIILPEILTTKALKDAIDMVQTRVQLGQ